MSRQLESVECQRCGVITSEVDPFLVFDIVSNAWRSGPICRDRRACHDRVQADRIAKSATSIPSRHTGTDQ